MLEFRKYKNEDKNEIIKLVSNLKKYYPDIQNWLDKELPRIENNEDDCIVVVFNNQIGGVAISGIEKGNYSTIKLRTFYLAEEMRGSGIGSYLLNFVIDKWIEKGFKKIFVTFAEEEVNELLGYFTEYGFALDGVFPLNYRDNTSEYYMSKLQVYKELTEKDFEDFVANYLFKLRGYKIIDRGHKYLIIQKLIAIKESYKIYVKIITDLEPKPDIIISNIEENARSNDCSSIIIVSYYDFELKNKKPNIKIIDGFDIETMFYPLTLKRQKVAGILSSVDKKYSDRLLYDGTQTLLIADKKSLRVDKVFYKFPNVKDVKRGNIFVFYETEPTQAIIGEGKIKEVIIDDPEIVFEKYDTKGLLNLKEVKSFADKDNNVLTLLIGKFRRYKKKIPYKIITDKLIQNYNPQSTMYLLQEDLDKIRVLGGVKDGK